MLELKLETYKEKFELDDEICRAFRRPLIFYCRQSDDPRNFFTTFVVMHFDKKEFVYYLSGSEENQKKTAAYPRQALLRSQPNHDPHATLRLGQSHSFYNFVENGQFFFLVEPEQERIKVFTGADLACEERYHIRSFGSTFYWLEEEPPCFYFTALTHLPNEGVRIHYYKSDADLKNITKIYEQPEQKGKCPHTTKKHRHYLLNSNFSNIEYKLVASREIIDRKELFSRTYRHLFAKYCQMIGENFSEGTYQQSVSVSNSQMCPLDPDFDLYIKSFYGNANFKELCDQIPECKFELAPGQITMLHLETLDLQVAKTTFAAPAHFEIDSETDHVYTSSHNFATFETRLFFGPAGIDKFQLIDGALIHQGVFVDPKGYRFTSHRFFRFDEQGYIVTIGKPNRLFIINADTMQLDHSRDIGNDFLSDHQAETLADALNHSQLRSIEFVALEVSQNGAFIFLVGRTSVIFYSMSKRKVVKEVPFLHPSMGSQYSLFETCYGKSIHCQYF